MRNGQTVPESPLSFQTSPLEQVRTLFVSFAQGLFYSAPQGQYHWEPDSNASEIIITDENPINVSTVGVRPAITFTRGPVQAYSLGMDDMLEYDFATGKKTKSVLIPGTMSINCCSRSDLESEKLAWILWEHLWMLREQMMRRGFFEIGRQNAIGSPSPAGAIVSNDSAREWYATVVTCPFQFYRTSSVYPLGASILANINMILTYRLQRLQKQNYGAAAGGNVPYRVERSFPPALAPDASDGRGQSPAPGEENTTDLDLIPHPLNPAVKVRIVRVKAPPPTLIGRSQPLNVLPINESRVEESPVFASGKTFHKV